MMQEFRQGKYWRLDGIKQYRVGGGELWVLDIHVTRDEDDNFNISALAFWPKGASPPGMVLTARKPAPKRASSPPPKQKPAAKSPGGSKQKSGAVAMTVGGPGAAMMDASGSDSPTEPESRTTLLVTLALVVLTLLVLALILVFKRRSSRAGRQ